MPIRYKNEFFQYLQTVRIPSNCNAITFMNNGLVDAKINTMPLLAGQSLSINGNENEMDATEYNIDFGTSTTGSIWVIKKINQ